METGAKHRSAFWALVLAGAIGCGLGAGRVPAYAQKAPAAVSATSPLDQDISSVDVQRGALDRFLDKHPEIENDVLGNPPTMSDPRYLHEHPELQAFLESHPLVKADPRAFLSPIKWRYYPRRSALGDLVPFLAWGCFLLAVFWVVRTLVENRRWNRSFKMHEDVQAKLIEKFASGQDFNAFMQSDTGRRLLEWTPPVMDTTARGLPNPLGRIFWSLQAGLVLLVVGLGLLGVRGGMAANAAPPLLFFGTLAMTLGTGFILSALVSYGLSKHLDLIAGATKENDSALKS
ncbi:MAG: hypothetical protein P4N24_13765 [Acidobacteriota bacterium]|nr:hypothetical protein [Acidobacteriota bacterium]